MKNKSNFKIKPDAHPPNVYIDPKYLKLVEEDITAFYPLLKRSSFIENLLKAYFDGVAGWKQRQSIVEDKDREEDPTKGKRQSNK